MQNELWLFTMRFPFGNSEAFLENELPILCERYDRVIIIPGHHDGARRPLPAKAEVLLLLKDPYRSASKKEMASSLLLILSLVRSLVKDAPTLAMLWLQWPKLRSRIAQLLYRAQRVGSELMPTYDPQRTTAYSYWTHDWATVLGLVKKQHPTLRYFSRAHGFDIYEEQNRDGWIPFRNFQLEHVDRIYCASRSGMEYLQARFPQRRDLFRLSRLGTTDHGPGPFDPTGPLKIASCSFLIPRKRVLFLVESLALMKHTVEWTHFGGGPEESLVREATARLPRHVKVDLRGMVGNADIIDWYTKEPVDVFVHLSKLEGGVAVAIQEAASFGIPVIATDSGGVREIMVPATGLLLSNSPTAKEVAEHLDAFREGNMCTKEFRDGVRQHWQHEFNANTSYNKFVDMIQLQGN